MTSIDLRVSPKTVQQQAVEKLRGAIISGMFKPGDRLLEAELCDLLGVSRPSVREALRSLEAERLVSLIPNKGPYIPILTWEHATEIYQVRAVLEGEAAALAAGRSSAEDIRAMRAALQEFEQSVQDDDAAKQVSSTARFYEDLFRLSGNRIIEETLTGLLARINFMRGKSMSMPGRAKVSMQEMVAILDAIEAGDSEAARRAAVYHVEQAHQSAEKAWQDHAGQ
ncbi:GntR family transcriptional regulator [Shinella zoogloeoides]|uniref:GntR family transcriptional regulator n=1 Tax=Shinella zoogloeoides TaxID=352475 RepID=UPI00299F1082|nr:GntR family transcriptional regulator [Shinella zoogloeoides]WPE24333.1 HTH-type transcriptional repressor RspR [Shinella zoogloeoides]